MLHREFFGGGGRPRSLMDCWLAHGGTLAQCTLGIFATIGNILTYTDGKIWCWYSVCLLLQHAMYISFKPGHNLEIANIHMH